MQILVPAHKYELSSMDGTAPQVLTFIRKEQQDGKFVTVEDGTTNEEVLAAVIDRIKGLNEKAPCRENSICLTHLETALLWLEKRTRDRHARGVEGTPKA